MLNAYGKWLFRLEMGNEEAPQRRAWKTGLMLKAEQG